METEVPALSRERRLPEALDFQALLEIGMRRAQERSGDFWTDYNKHDPGVTILEQACYALIDIAYRASHPVADLIETVFAESGDREARMAVDFPLPHRALTSAPVTEADFRAALVDQFPGIRGLWFNECTSTFSADKTEHPVTKVEVLFHCEPPGICEEADILEFLQDLRLLGQPIAGIKTIEHEPYDFTAKIEALSGYEPDDLIAAILHRVDLELNLPYQFQSRAEFADRWTSDALHEGPFLGHGIATQWDQPREQPRCDATWLRRIITSVDGVASVVSVEVRTPKAQEGHMLVVDMVEPLKLIKQIDVTGPNATPQAGPLRMFRDAADDSVSMRLAHISADLRFRMKSIIESNQRAKRDSEAVLSRRPPRGKLRPRISEYRSIQHDLPGIYRLSEETKAASNQTQDEAYQKLNLRAYLSLLEQPLADLLEQLRLMPDLLSPGLGDTDRPEATYRAGNLASDLPTAPPEFRELLLDCGCYATRVSDALGRSDPGGARYEHFLDHLLARYDEAFANDELRQFERPTPEERSAEIATRIRCKQAFLRELVAPEAETTALCQDIGLSTHRGHVKRSGKAPKATALARRVQLKTLMDEPPMVLEHHLLADACPPSKHERRFFVFKASSDPDDKRESVALRVEIPRERSKDDDSEKIGHKMDVFLHDAGKLPGIDKLQDRLSVIAKNANMVVRQDPYTCQTWHMLHDAEDGRTVVLLSPVPHARDPLLERFQKLAEGLVHADAKVSPILYPADFGARRLSIIAQNRTFENEEASKAHAVLIEKTVLEEAPITLEPTVITSAQWPHTQDNIAQTLHYESFEAFRTAVQKLVNGDKEGNSAGEKVKLMRNIAECAYQKHLAALARVVPS